MRVPSDASEASITLQDRGDVRFRGSHQWDLTPKSQLPTPKGTKFFSDHVVRVRVLEDQTIDRLWFPMRWASVFEGQTHSKRV